MYQELQRQTTKGLLLSWKDTSFRWIMQQFSVGTVAGHTAELWEMLKKSALEQLSDHVVWLHRPRPLEGEGPASLFVGMKLVTSTGRGGELTAQGKPRKHRHCPQSTAPSLSTDRLDKGKGLRKLNERSERRGGQFGQAGTLWRWTIHRAKDGGSCGEEHKAELDWLTRIN